MNGEILETYTMTPEEEIKWLRQCVRELQKEKEDLKAKLENNTKIYLNTSKYASEMESKYVVENYIVTELEKWLEEALNELKQNNVYDRTSYEMGQVIATECIIAKIEELKGGNNE